MITNACNASPRNAQSRCVLLMAFYILFTSLDPRTRTCSARSHPSGLAKYGNDKRNLHTWLRCAASGRPTRILQTMLRFRYISYSIIVLCLYRNMLRNILYSIIVRCLYRYMLRHILYSIIALRLCRNMLWDILYYITVLRLYRNMLNIYLYRNTLRHIFDHSSVSIRKYATHSGTKFTRKLDEVKATFSYLLMEDIHFQILRYAHANYMSFDFITQ